MYSGDGKTASYRTRLPRLLEEIKMSGKGTVKLPPEHGSLFGGCCNIGNYGEREKICKLPLFQI